MPEAARRPSTEFDEEVAVADILRLALDGKLQISVNFVNRGDGSAWKIHWGCRSCSFCRRGMYLYKPFQFPTVSTTYFSTLSSEQQQYLNKRRQYVPLKLGQDVFIVLNDGVATIQGVWDLAMIGNERLNVEHAYQEATHGAVGNAPVL